MRHRDLEKWYEHLKQRSSDRSIGGVRFTDDTMIVRLSDGREVSVPLEWFPGLRDATPEQRRNWRFIAKGIGVQWEDIDEDIGVSTLLRM
ncbi:MAG: DUF2442 domain-containing protein [Ardenticatenaceae bacterium]|nr:DUF2442 domain-containing protein [Ardenticatenaceae bacterium]